MRLPSPRGPLSERVFAALGRPSASVTTLDASGEGTPGSLEDRSLTLWVLHELHYRGFDEVDGRWEWAPVLMPLRRVLEDELEERLRERYAAAFPTPETPTAGIASSLASMIESHDGPSLARHLQKTGTREQAMQLLRQRSLYHLKEADPTSWVIPRLTTRPKAALMEVQFDEYGEGRPQRLHHHLFQRGLLASGLDAAYGAYVDETTPEVLEQNNALSMFGLQRRLRGAALGHLAAFEATSAVPSRQLVQGLTRLGFPEPMVAYYDEHVIADAVHEQLALRDICGVLVEEEPELRADVLLGAWSCLDLESRTATAMLDLWDAA